MKTPQLLRLYFFLASLVFFCYNNGQGRIKASAGPGAVSKMRALDKLLMLSVLCVKRLTIVTI